MKKVISKEKTIDKYYLKLILLCFLVNQSNKKQVSLTKFCKTHNLNRNFRIAVKDLGIIKNAGTVNSRKYEVLINGITKKMAEDVLLFSDAKSKGIKIIIDEKKTLWDYLKNFLIKQDKSNVLSLKSYKPQTQI
jgi:hypothetical protein